MAFVTVAVLLGESNSLSFPGLEDSTFGIDHVRGGRGKAMFVSEAGGGYYDGKISTSPPDSIHSDRRLESYVKVGWDAPTGNGVMRFRLQGNGLLRTEEDNLDPKIYIDERSGSAKGTADGSFQLQNGLEILGGVVGTVYPGYKRITSTANGKSKRTYDSTALVNPRAGMAKRGGDWAAGAYVMLSSERSRDYKEDVFDGSTSSGSEVVSQPTRIAAFGGTPMGPLKVDGEFAIVQGGSVGSKDAGGRNVGDDSFAMQVAGEFPLYAATRGRVGIYHQTLAYADQSYMNLDNIPATAFRFESFIQEGSFRGSAALVYGFGKDDQSLPEFNASYSYRAVGVVGAVQVSF